MLSAFSSLPIRAKLLLLVLMPLAALVFFSSLAVQSKRTTVLEMDSVIELAALSVDLGNTAHELQKERGLSSGFLASKGEKFGPELTAQRQDSDKALSAVRKHLSSFPVAGYPVELKDSIAKALKGLEGVEARRKDVDAKALEPGEIITFYSAAISALLDVNSSIMRTSRHPEVLRSIAAYDALLWAKEYAGRERATLNGAFALNSFPVGLYRGWITVLSAQNERMAGFNAFAAPAQVAFLEQTMTGPDVEAVTSMRAQAMENARKESLGGDAPAWFKASTGRINLLRDVEARLATDLSTQTARLGHEARLSMYVYLAMGLSAVCATLVVALLVFRAISTPLRQAVAFAQAVSAGNLDHPLAVRQRDEIGTLCDAMSDMVKNLKEMIAEAKRQSNLAAEEAERARSATAEAEQARAQAEDAKRQGMLQAAERIQGVVRKLTQACEQIAAQVEQSSHGAQIQKDRVTETATAMEEMNATVLEVAQNAGRASESSHGAQNKAKDGATTVSRMIQRIDEVRSQALNLKENMALLGRSAGDIGQVMGVINDIADQTNLLALNAAIEAARAGDAGRGFAVVADEVRKLAEKTMAATREVAQTIQGIQQATQTNAQSVELTVGGIEAATDMAGESGHSLGEIVDMVEQANDQVRAIAAAAEEQSAASEEINRSLTDINTISTETAEAMGHSARAVADLSSQAEALARLVEEMAAEGRG